MEIERFTGDLSAINHIADAWIRECSAQDMGIDIDANVYLADLLSMVTDEGSDLLVLKKNGQIAGLIGLTTFNSPLGEQKIANEHYWYVLPEYRGISSLRLIRAAENWAIEKGCSHLTLNASCLASDMHDTVCRIYEKLGMKKFETTYIKQVK